jgi:hypothetical protein
MKFLELNMKIFIVLLVLVPFSLIMGCQSVNDNKEITQAMRNVNNVHERLFSYVWSKDQFENPDNKEAILSLLVDLHAHFDKLKVTQLTDNKIAASKDPGFEITLRVQEDLLKEARDRFEQGDLPYAKFKLKGITENCIVCHSRFEVKSDFDGSRPIAEGTDFEDRIRIGEYLVATRQFARASDYLYSLAKEVSELSSGSSLALDAVRLWLLVEVRVKEDFHGSASQLSSLIDKPSFQGDTREVLSRWVVDLQSLQSNKQTQSDTLDSKSLLSIVKDLLGGKFSSRTLGEDNLDFIKTARCSALLHVLLARELSLEERRETLKYLAIAYSRMPILFLKHLAPMYQELLIRNFPHSIEAREVFKLYKEQFEFERTGSGGDYATAEDLLKLEDLDKLAN